MGKSRNFSLFFDPGPKEVKNEVAHLTDLIIDSTNEICVSVNNHFDGLVQSAVVHLSKSSSVKKLSSRIFLVPCALVCNVQENLEEIEADISNSIYDFMTSVARLGMLT